MDFRRVNILLVGEQLCLIVKNIVYTDDVFPQTYCKLT